MTEDIQQTLVLIKPDGVQRGLVGEIITRLEARGLRIAAMKMHTAGRGDSFPSLRRAPGAPIL